MLANLRRGRIPLLAWSGILLGIVCGVVRAHWLLPLGQAIIGDLVTLFFFGVAGVLLSKRVSDQYLLLYSLGFFTVSVASPSFHLFAPATLLILIAAVMRFFQRRIE